MTPSARWLLLVGLAVAACGPTHHGVGGPDGGGPPPGDAAEPIDGPPAPTDACSLTSCAAQGAFCGLIGDGCNGTIDCGGCPMGETCGGGGVPFQCGGGGGSGSGTCTPRTCLGAGADCGIISDNCGSAIDCGSSCPTGELCQANICGLPPCVGPLCTDVPSCMGSAEPTTTITGVVTAPGHDDTATWGTPDPIYGALVYIPNGSAGAPTYGVQPFGSGVTCETCSSDVTGDPLISVTTGVDGKFTLTGAPCGINIPLVIQLGRWRREITIPSVACCATNTLTNAETHLPRTHTGVAGDVYSDIPLMAFTTGDLDTLHCVLRKIGVSDTEFTNPTGSGRVHFYLENGATIDSSTPQWYTLYGSAAELAKYDMVLFECPGDEYGTRTNPNTGYSYLTGSDQQRLIDYANAGGRVYATHYAYVWLTNNSQYSSTAGTGPAPWSQTATWDPRNEVDGSSATGTIDTSLQNDSGTQIRRKAFADWLYNLGESSTYGEIPVNVVRKDFTAVNSAPATMSGAPAQVWITGSYTGENIRTTANVMENNVPLHYTFDTPVSYTSTAPTTQCGRVLYSDFHVSDAVSYNDTFPAECSNGPMNAQEKTLEFMLFDLASCVGTVPPVCTPKTCADQGLYCGESGDGCDDGVILDCGSCGSGTTCGGGGSAGVCGMGPMCTPLTCMEQNAQCGYVGDGCGSAVYCGDCPSGQTCGGNGQANQCGGIVIQ